MLTDNKNCTVGEPRHMLGSTAATSLTNAVA
jgi:hypothetical protein